MSDEKKLGRPTKYREEYDEEIIELAEIGLDMYSIAWKWGVCHDTLLEWQRVNPSFSLAYKRARTIQTAQLLQDLIHNRGNRDYNHKLAGLLLAHVARLREEKMLEMDVGTGDLKERSLQALDYSKEGSHTADEISKIIDAISKIAKVEEVTELRQKLEKLEELSKK